MNVAFCSQILPSDASRHRARRQHSPRVARFSFNLPVLAVISSLFISHEAMAHGDLHERIEALSRQVEANPTNAALRLERADVNRQHGELDAALADADVAVRLKPDWAPAILQRARVLFDEGKFTAAKSAAEACLKVDPENFDALVIRARCHAVLNQPGDAVADMTRVLSGKDRPLPDLYLERARWQAGLGEFAAAVRGLDEGMARLGETPSLALPAIEYERQRGDFDSALARLEKAARFVPATERLAMRGEVLEEAARFAAARQAFEQALAEFGRLPEQRRQLPAMQAVERRVRDGLQRVNGSANRETRQGQPLRNGGSPG